jgi:hypothetical protein
LTPIEFQTVKENGTLLLFSRCRCVTVCHHITFCKKRYADPSGTRLKRTVREIVQLPALRKYYCERFKWSDNIFAIIDSDIFRPVYKKYTSTKGIQWMQKICIKKLPTGERIHKRDHFHDKRCVSCWHTLEDDNHIFQCTKRRSLRKKVINQITLMRNRGEPRMCDILQEGLLTYFKGDSVRKV